MACWGIGGTGFDDHADNGTPKAPISIIVRGSMKARRVNFFRKRRRAAKTSTAPMNRIAPKYPSRNAANPNQWVENDSATANKRAINTASLWIPRAPAKRTRRLSTAQIPETIRRTSGDASRKDGTKMFKRTIARPAASDPPVTSQSFPPLVALHVSTAHIIAPLLHQPNRSETILSASWYRACRTLCKSRCQCTRP